MSAMARGVRSVAIGAALIGAVLTGAACSDGSDAGTAPTAPVVDSTAGTLPPPSAAPETTIPATTSTTSTTSTTVPATTSTIPPTLPVPIDPPENPRANEPEVQLGTIEIPSLGVSKTLFSGITLTTLDRGPGHWPGTAMPGDYGNVVVAGHRTSRDRPFRHIDQLTNGDEVVFTTAAGRFVYVVTGIEVVQPDALWIVDQLPGHTATLFACHPVGSTRERIVVHLQLDQQ